MFMIEIDAESHYALLGVSPTATAAEIRQARDSIVKDLRETARREPDSQAELNERIKAVNAAGDQLARPARRAEYDREHPDLRLFTVRVAAAPMFTDAAERVHVWYRSIAEHLAAAGLTVRPLSDLDRADFTADETPNDLLDDLMDQRRP